MADYRKLAIDLIAADGKIDETEIKLLKKTLYNDNKVSNSEVEFLLEVRTAVNRKTKDPNPEFDKFFLKVLTDHLLADGKIDVEEVALIKKSVIGDKKIPAIDIKKFLENIKKKAASVHADFDKAHEAFAKKMAS